MATKTIKELYSLVESPFLFDKTMVYPDIEGNESNFLTYYDDYKDQFDRFFLIDALFQRIQNDMLDHSLSPPIQIPGQAQANPGM